MSQIASTPGAVHAEREAIRAYPPTVTFRDLIASNKRRSAMLMVALVVVLIILGALIAASIGPFVAAIDSDAGGSLTLQDLLPSALLGAAVALVLGAIACSWSWFGGANAILVMAGAVPIEKNDDPQLFNVVDELRLAAGLPMPRVYLIPSRAMNAFATGRDPKHAAVAITTTLREKLTRDELAGVIAHELAHIRHYDVRFMMLMATLVGLIVFLCDVFLRSLRHARFRGSGKGKGAGPLIIVVLVLALVFAIIAPILAAFIQFAISRQREYLADAGAVELTRYPEGLASALRKLSDASTPLDPDKANRAIAHLYIINPLKKSLRAHGALDSVFSTHPPVEKRIARILALTR